MKNRYLKCRIGRLYFSVFHIWQYSMYRPVQFCTKGVYFADAFHRIEKLPQHMGSQAQLCLALKLPVDSVIEGSVTQLTICKGNSWILPIMNTVDCFLNTLLVLFCLDPHLSELYSLWHGVRCSRAPGQLLLKTGCILVLPMVIVMQIGLAQLGLWLWCKAEFYALDFVLLHK